MKKKIKFGFVYILSNESMPDLVKIGLTTALPEDRSKQLYTTSIPTPFKVEYRVLTSTPRMLESKIHEMLTSVRVSRRREFFKLSVEDAIDAIRVAALEINGIDNWSSKEARSITSDDKFVLSLERGEVFALLSYPTWNSAKPELKDIWQAHSDGDQVELHGVNSTLYTSSFSANDLYSELDPIPFLDRDNKVVNGIINGREILYSGERLVWLPSYENRKTQSSVIFEAITPVQVVSRTWTPRLSSIGVPLLLNDFLYEEFWDEAREGINNAIKLRQPRTWEPSGRRTAEWGGVGILQQPPSFWLPQLKPRRKKA
ncbi:hypothetical protein GNP80_15140 [Aliivibrio fischeri]|uniref:GIY-YIG nuclease family protein n=1 Tax=Aliivibrio fischeri TaxID=668 RepID=UPI0012DA676C|nr:GIY-YIG nuclease family protein [Aliivibrio fischeri]MUK93765.1 hypothetical protein [Aliivibrio fischeri]